MAEKNHNRVRHQTLRTQLIFGDEFDFLPLRVTRLCNNGKYRYDPAVNRKLIEACLRPGASIAGLTLKAGVIANQLH